MRRTFLSHWFGRPLWSLTKRRQLWRDICRSIYRTDRRGYIIKNRAANHYSGTRTRGMCPCCREIYAVRLDGCVWSHACRGVPPANRETQATSIPTLRANTADRYEAYAKLVRAGVIDA